VKNDPIEAALKGIVTQQVYEEYATNIWNKAYPVE
jgi:hypothetical protein